MRRLTRSLKGPLPVALLACVLVVPVGLVVASSSDAVSDERSVAVEVTGENADADAAFDELRDKRRLALARLVSRMKRWGDEGDAAAIARHEAEIADLGGVSAEEQAEIDRKLDRTITDEEYDAYLRANLSPEDYERVKSGLQPLDPPEDPEPPQPSS